VVTHQGPGSLDPVAHQSLLESQPRKAAFRLPLARPSAASNGAIAVFGFPVATAPWQRWPIQTFDFSRGLSILRSIVIGRQFCGPPNSGNGGYVCGVLSEGVEGPATAVLRAPIPLDEPLSLAARDGAQVLLGAQGQLIGQAAPAAESLPEPPAAPSLEAARAAGARHLGFSQRIHPICFTCGAERGEGDGLRVFPGRLEGAAPGVVACAWTPHATFAEPDGTVGAGVIWAALDCPGFFAWVEKEGRHGALLGTMTGEVLGPVKAGEPHIVLAWPLARDGRKETAGVALFTAEGALVARGRQVWIVMGPRPAAGASVGEPATA
jgi:acyl-coenzyme A thioesterase PaaI-like protein